MTDDSEYEKRARERLEQRLREKTRAVAETCREFTVAMAHAFNTPDMEKWVGKLRREGQKLSLVPMPEEKTLPDTPSARREDLAKLIKSHALLMKRLQRKDCPLSDEARNRLADLYQAVVDEYQKQFGGRGRGGR